MIELPHGGGAKIDEFELVAFIRACLPPRDYIIQGQKKVTFAEHPKKESLDYWLRQQTRRRDSMQAVTRVVDALIETGLFVREDKLLCPDSRRSCKGLRLK